jgi:hypothetical protein
MSDFFCSDLARAEGDQVLGTAKTIRLYLAVEYWPPWHRKAAQSELLPAEVRGWLSDLKGRIPDSRFLLVRQPESKDRKPACFVAIPCETGSALYRFSLRDYADLLSLDIDAILAGRSELPSAEAPMFLVCTHGKHDKCCARNGNPVVNALREEFAAEVWETSHLGGCRFAANLLCLPQGLLYGQISPANASAVIRRHKQGAVTLEHFRGRCSFSKPVQAAEHFLRREMGIHGIDQLRLAGSTAAGQDHWITHFQLAGAATTFTIEHSVSRSATPRLVACSDTEPEFIWTHHLSEIRSS